MSRTGLAPYQTATYPPDAHFLEMRTQHARHFKMRGPDQIEYGVGPHRVVLHELRGELCVVETTLPQGADLAWLALPEKNYFINGFAIHREGQGHAEIAIAEQLTQHRICVD